MNTNQIEEMEKLQDRLINRSCIENNLKTSLLLMEAAEAIGNLLAGRHEWISIEDRLPENKINYIVYYKHRYCDDDGYWAIGMSFYDGNEFHIGLAYKVTHWMPLPAPPTEKEN